MGYNISMNNEQGFRVIADDQTIRINTWGKTIHELFRNSLRGMAVLMQPTVLTAGEKAKKVKQFLRVEALDLNTLLAEFLSKVIGLSDIHNLIFTNVTFKNIGDNFLEGEISGVSTDEIEREIKAISYQDVDIKRNLGSGLYETMLVFDI